MLQELVDALGDVRKVAVRIDACISVNGEVYDHASAALKNNSQSNFRLFTGYQSGGYSFY